MWNVCFNALFIGVPLLLILVILLWFMNLSMDQDRIRGYLEFRGNKVLESKQLPGKKEWWARALERGYEVRYLDGQGHEHFAVCSTGLFKGLVWLEDKYLRYADQVEGTPMPGKTDVKPESVEEENRRLREELARLQAKKKKKQP
jgi:hypothetical protein